MPSDAPWWAVAGLAVLSAVLPVVTFFLGQKFQVDRDKVAANRAREDRQADRDAAREERQAQHEAEAAEQQRRREHEADLARTEGRSAQQRLLADAFVDVLEASQAMVETLQLAMHEREHGLDKLHPDRAVYRSFITAISRLRVLIVSGFQGYDERLSETWSTTTNGYVELFTPSASTMDTYTAIDALHSFIKELPGDFTMATDIANED